MHEMNSFVRQLIPVSVAALFFGLTLWQTITSRGRRVSWTIPFVFGVVFTIAFLIFARQASSINRLRHLDAANISSITYKGETYRDQGQVRPIVEALNQVGWWSPRRSDMLQYEPLSIYFHNGSEWDMRVGLNRYGSGTIISMADRELSRGYALSPTLHDALTHAASLK